MVFGWIAIIALDEVPLSQGVTWFLVSVGETGVQSSEVSIFLFYTSHLAWNDLATVIHAASLG